MALARERLFLQDGLDADLEIPKDAGNIGEHPGAIDRAYHYHRARRNARIRRQREKTQARLRFIFTFLVLVGLAIFLMLTTWHEIEKVFGL